MPLPIRAIVLTSLLAALTPAPAAAQAVECSPVIKNPACTVTINRESPSTPQPFLMTGHAAITISIQKRPFDKIEVNSTFTDVASANPLEAILKAFSPSFGNLTFKNWSLMGENQLLQSMKEETIPREIKNPGLLLELQWIDRQQIAAKAALTKSKTALDVPSKALTAFAGKPAGTWNPDTLKAATDALIEQLNAADDISIAAGVTAALGQAVANAHRQYAALGRAKSPADDAELRGLITLLNDIESHQAQLEASAKSLVGSQDGLRAARTILEAINTSEESRANSLLFTKKIATSDHGPARSVKSTVTLTDLLSKDKTELGTILASWNSTRWEVSLGTVFSSRPIRSYSVASSVIVESNTRPMVVPFALAHFNLWETTAGEHRVALLASGGMGVNPNTKSTDFGYGLSLSYRGVYLSGLNHKARETVLAGGLVTGQTVASSVTTAPTELKWKSRTRLGIALTLRVPF